MKGNREYKSDVFSLLLKDQQNALDLYNAINHSDYTDPAMVEICTLDRGVSLSVRNDAAFVLDMNLSIYEHQSTVTQRRQFEPVSKTAILRMRALVSIVVATATTHSTAFAFTK